MNKAMGMLAGAALLVIGAGTASAATFTSDHCDPLCGPQPTGFATITGTQIGVDTVQVTITPLNGNGLVGGTGGLTTFTFNSLQDQAITFDFGLNASLFVVSNDGAIVDNTASAGSIHQDGFGDFEYGFNYIKPGGSDPFFGPLTFTLSGTGLTLASFAELSTGGAVDAFFALDIISGQGNIGQTGVVDCCVGQPTPFDVPGETPIPGAVWLFGGGLGLVAMLGGRRKRKQKSVWEVTQNA